MSKTLLALAAAASIAAATVSSPAQADCRGCGVAAGMLIPDAADPELRTLRVVAE